MHGQSGASVAVFGDIVVKHGHRPEVVELLRAQASWLRRCHHGTVPVLASGEHGSSYAYVMPRLDEVRRDEDNDAETVACLERYVWHSDRSRRVVDWVEHRLYVSELLELHGLWETYGTWWREWTRRIERYDLEVVTTHGDPTRSNRMRNSAGDLVLIDPIPANERMPSLRAVDLGKMAQSLLGYEHVRFGWPMPTTDVDKFIDSFAYDDAEREATRYFTLVHLLRLLRYTPDHLRKEFVDVIDRMGLRWRPL